MCVYIGIEDLAANALIEILKNGTRRFVSYSELEEYGMAVIEILKSNGEDAVLLLSRESTDNMFRNYSDIFEEATVEGAKGISLQTGIDVDKLIEKFRGYLAWDVLLAFVNKKSLEKLGVVA